MSSTLPSNWAELEDGALWDELNKPKRERPRSNGFSATGDTTAPGDFRDKSKPLPLGVELKDFHAYMPMHSYIFAPTGEMWPASSVNARLPTCNVDSKEIKASAWLDCNQAVEQMTWSPGLPTLIQNRLVSDGGWTDREGVTCFNLYRPPTIKPGDARQAEPWLAHIRKIYPDDADHIVKWLAQRVQRPQDKINHALLLGGQQGIGKDTLLEPVKYAVGAWNFKEVSPIQLLGRFNSFVKTVILRVSEARDLGDVNRYQLYDHMKVYTAAPPDVLRVDQKHLQEHSVINCCGVIITTNFKTDGIYLSADDRRHYVAWSELKKESFDENYWNRIWQWYEAGGIRHVAAYLAELDISEFDCKAPPPKTAAFWAIVDASRAPEDAELADVIEGMGDPPAFTLGQISVRAQGDTADWIRDRKNRRMIPHRLEQCGYVPIRNDGAKDGQWKIGGKRQVVYVKTGLAIREQIRAAQNLTG